MSKHKKKNRNKRKQQPPDSGASSHNMPQSPTTTDEQQAAMSLEAFRQPLQSLPQQQHYAAEGSTPHLPFEQPNKLSVSVQQQPAILDPPCDLNSLIKLASDLYCSTIGVLPPQHRPDQDSILKTLTSWAHLCALTGSELSVRDQVIAQLQQEMVMGKVADVVYVLGSFSPFSFMRPQADQTVEINNHRNKQRNQQTQELLKLAASVLEMPVIVRKLTAMNNPYLTE
jgi:hypothetical protein